MALFFRYLLITPLVIGGTYPLCFWLFRYISATYFYNDGMDLIEEGTSATTPTTKGKRGQR